MVNYSRYLTERNVQSEQGRRFKISRFLLVHRFQHFRVSGLQLLEGSEFHVIKRHKTEYMHRHDVREMLSSPIDLGTFVGSRKLA